MDKTEELYRGYDQSQRCVRLAQWALKNREEFSVWPWEDLFWAMFEFPGAIEIVEALAVAVLEPSGDQE